MNYLPVVVQNSFPIWKLLEYLGIFRNISEFCSIFNFSQFSIFHFVGIGLGSRTMPHHEIVGVHVGICFVFVVIRGGSLHRPYPKC